MRLWIVFPEHTVASAFVTHTDDDQAKKFFGRVLQCDLRKSGPLGKGPNLDMIHQDRAGEFSADLATTTMRMVRIQRSTEGSGTIARTVEL